MHWMFGVRCWMLDVRGRAVPRRRWKMRPHRLHLLHVSSRIADVRRGAGTELPFGRRAFRVAVDSLILFFPLNVQIS